MMFLLLIPATLAMLTLVHVVWRMANGLIGWAPEPPGPGPAVTGPTPTDWDDFLLRLDSWSLIDKKRTYELA